MKMKYWRNRPEPSGLFGTDKTLHSSITLADCGLDPECNFMQSPECECGCGGETDVLLEDMEDVINFCAGMVMENDCEYCAVFALNKENKLFGVIKYEDEIIPIASKEPFTDLSKIGEMFYEMELHCFGLIVWVDEEKYRIVEE